MKRILTMTIAVMALFAAVSCTENGITPTIEFERTSYDIINNDPIEVVVKMNSISQEDVNIPLALDGTAVLNEDFALSSTSVLIRSGQTKGTVTVTPLESFQNKELVFNILEVPEGFILGENSYTILEDNEALICTFKNKSADLLEKYTVEVEVSGVETGSKFAAEKEIRIPVRIVKNGPNTYETSGEELVIKEGERVGTLDFTCSQADPAKATTVSVTIDKERAGQRFIEGDVTGTTLNVRGKLNAEELLGTWEFKETYDLEEIQLWFMEMEDDPELLPTNNEGFKLTFTEKDGKISVKPSGTGDWMNYFKESAISWTAPKNIVAKGKQFGEHCTSETNMFMAEVGYTNIELTYFKLDKVNRSFNAEAPAEGAGVIAMRFNKDGNLEIHLKDYDTPPFGEMWWDDGSKFDSEMFGFASCFTKVK